jgi:hypothetical protein
MRTNKTSAAPGKIIGRSSKMSKRLVFLGKTRGKWGKGTDYLALLWEGDFLLFLWWINHFA